MKSKISSVVVAASLMVATGAFAQGGHAGNVDVLRSIPLVKGYEKKVTNESAITTELVEYFKKLGDKNRSADGSLNRATHNKGTCIDGQMKVFSKEELQKAGLPDILIGKLKNGFFENSGIYNIQARFANAKGTGESNPDTTPDVRGMSISIDTNGSIKDFAGESRLDFMMNSTPMFAVRNITEFTNLMRLVTGNIKAIEVSQTVAVAKAIYLLKQNEKNDTKSYATENYWSNVPYVHGLKKDGSPAQIAKYKLTPCDGLGRQSESSEGKSPNYLQSEIKGRAIQGGICFDLQVQLFDQQKLQAHKKHLLWSTADWIENAGELWEEEVLPFYTVARFKVPNKKSSIVDAESCGQRYFNTRLHSTLENMPIGSLSRVRAEVEEVSRARRMNEAN